jgi:hypothetical protein
MKVIEVTAKSTTVDITLEPENPAEVALVNLLHSCEAECNAVPATVHPEQKAAVPQPKLPPTLRITATVKSSSPKSRY